METVLLRMVADVVIGQDLPMDHGWIVQNTETLYVLRAFRDGRPTTHKYVHVGGNVPHHRFLEVPVGTPPKSVVEAAGRQLSDLDGEILADGGPGWCFDIENPDEFGVTKRTNCVLVLDADTAEENTLGNEGRINVVRATEWDGDHETEPTETLRPERVRVPLITNPAFEGVVAPSDPIVSTGDSVSTGEMIATPSSEGISNPQHASIDGEVTAVTDRYVEITRGEDAEATRAQAWDADQPTYWTWCLECGEYVTMTDAAGQTDPTEYVCENCR
jgi:Na+-translocating ferredoxin:NAD+ oxidoreductase RnfC subunit